MSDTNWLQQISREQEYLEHGYQKLIDTLDRDSKRANFSNTFIGRAIKSSEMADLIAACDTSIADLMNPEKAGMQRAERYVIMRDLFNAWFLARPRKVKEYSPAPLMAHVALQAMLDQAEVPYHNNLTLLPGQRSPDIRPKVTIEKLQTFIGREIHFQLKLELIKEVLGGWVVSAEKHCSENGSNRYYHHLNFEQRIANLIADVELCETPKPSWFDVDTSQYDEKARKRATPKAVIKAQKLLKEAELRAIKEKRMPLSDSELEDVKAKVFDKVLERHNSALRVKALIEHIRLGEAGCRHLGSWIYGIVYDTTGLFDKKTEAKLMPVKDEYGKPKLRKGKPVLKKEFGDYIYLSAKGDRRYNNLIKEEDQRLMTQVPMLCPPRTITRDDVGGWIGDEGSPTQWSPKGYLEMSDLHLEFYNRQAAVPFKLNGFIFKIMETMVEQDVPLKLGSFKPHRKRDITPTALRFVTQEEVEGMSREQRKQLAISKVGEAVYEEEQQRSEQQRQEQRDLLDEAIASWESYRMAQRVKDDAQFFIPVRPDFRGRVIPRVPHLGYQQPDHGKALILFAKDHPIDKASTKGWLLRQLANNFGNNVDKLSFTDRERKMQEPIVQEYIKAIATMNDEDGSFSLGFEAMKIIDGQDGDCWQFAAAAKEFYDIFIAKTKTTTNLPVTVDCSTSGQQIMAGWRKSHTLASRTNCVSLPEPADLYGAIWSLALDMIEGAGKGFTKETRKLLVEHGYGRKIIKAGFQGAQYGAGVDTQLAGISEKISKLRSSNLVNLSDEEEALFHNYYPEALDELCDLTTVNLWFADVAKKIYGAGKHEILIPCPNGSIIRTRYPQTKTQRIDTFGYGNTEFSPDGKAPRRRISMTTPDTSVRPMKERWRTGLSPNTVHGAGDAALISLALHDYTMPFTSCHDSLGTYAGKPMDDLCQRVREAYVKVADWDMFAYILQINEVHMDYLPIIADAGYDSKNALKAAYLIS